MGVFARNLGHTFATYLDLEATSQTKHEYYDGEIYAMAGGTPEHAALSMAVGGALFSQLAGKGCTVYSSDLRVRVLETGLATYPDVTVVCGRAETDPSSSATVTNPTVIVEVLSDSTERYDTGEKFEHYKKISSLQCVVFVSPRSRQIDVWTRSSDQWSVAESRAGEEASLAAIRCTLNVDAIFGVLNPAT